MLIPLVALKSLILIPLIKKNWSSHTILSWFPLSRAETMLLGVVHPRCDAAGRSERTVWTSSAISRGPSGLSMDRGAYDDALVMI